MPSAACFALIRKSEGLRLKAYQAEGELRIGYRHTGPDVGANKKITHDEAEALLHADVTHASDSALQLTDGKVTQGQLDALTDFIFDLGSTKLSGSTLLKEHKAGNYNAAAAEFGRWVYEGGKECADMIERRARETLLYLGCLPS